VVRRLSRSRSSRRVAPVSTPGRSPGVLPGAVPLPSTGSASIGVGSAARRRQAPQWIPDGFGSGCASPGGGPDVDGSGPRVSLCPAHAAQRRGSVRRSPGRAPGCERRCRDLRLALRLAFRGPGSATARRNAMSVSSPPRDPLLVTGRPAEGRRSAPPARMGPPDRTTPRPMQQETGLRRG
jgi:hypothetical protein